MKLEKGNLLDQIQFGTDVRALSFNNPFGTLMLHGKKETRTRNTNVRGLVLICTCLKPYSDREILDIAGVKQYNRIHTAQYTRDNTMGLYGYAIGIGELHNSRPMVETDEDDAYVQYKEGKYIWEFKDVYRIHPIPIKGKQGWAILSSETQSKIEIIS